VPTAFYVSKRKPADWAKDNTAEIVVRFKLLEESPRLVSTWGTWRKRRTGKQREGTNQPVKKCQSPARSVGATRPQDGSHD
jgi:hypothetical protein